MAKTVSAEEMMGEMTLKKKGTFNPAMGEDLADAEDVWNYEIQSDNESDSDSDPYKL